MGPFQVQLHGSEAAGPSPESMEGHGLVAIVFTYPCTLEPRYIHSGKAN